MKLLFEQDHYEVLEIPRDAGPDGIERAYRLILSTYSEDSLALYSMVHGADAAAIRERVAHRRLADDRSDFLSLVKLWSFVQERIEHKKSNRKLTDDLKSHFLSPRRVREWIDVHGQLATIATEGLARERDAGHLRAAAPRVAQRAARQRRHADSRCPPQASRRTPARAASSSTSGPARRC